MNLGDCTCMVIGDTGALDSCVCLPEGERKRIVAVVGKGEGGKKLMVEGLDIDGLKEALSGRGNIVMTRVRDEELERIDALVHAGLFDSRSEAAAFLIQQGISAQSELFKRVADTAAKIQELKEKMRKEIAG